MISSLMALALGVAGGIEAAKVLERAKERLRPHGGATGMLIDKINEKLEQRAAVDDHPSGHDRF